MTNKEILNYVRCPLCKKELVVNKGQLVCQYCDRKFSILNSNTISLLPESILSGKLSLERWERLYQKQFENGSYREAAKNYQRDYLEDTIAQLNEAKTIIPSTIFLEIGCGQMFLGQEIAKKAKLVIGIDFSPTALKIADKVFQKQEIKNYLLILGDIQQMPIKEKSVDLIYGGGVIEHFKNTQKCVNELYRVLKTGGASFNTVPYLNIGALTYRQIWGNIPNFPVLKQLAEFIHIKLLKSRYMIFGYEFSFLGFTLKKIHKKAGFKKVKVDKFKVKLVFDFAPKLFRPLLVKLANSSRLFWPMIKVIGKK